MIHSTQHLLDEARHEQLLDEFAAAEATEAMIAQRRDRLAEIALTAIVTAAATPEGARALDKQCAEAGLQAYDFIARQSYCLADAMLKARDA